VRPLEGAGHRRVRGQPYLPIIDWIFRILWLDYISPLALSIRPATTWLFIFMVGPWVGRTAGGSVANPGACPPCGMHGGPQPARRLPAPPSEPPKPLP